MTVWFMSPATERIVRSLAPLDQPAGEIRTDHSFPNDTIVAVDDDEADLYEASLAEARKALTAHLN